MIYITGDTHGDMNRIVLFCERMETSQEDIMIILGDVDLNYYGDSRDRRNKEKVANIPITLFCIHGNHERRPTTIVEFKLQEWNGGKVWVEEAYPNILFAKDGEIYDMRYNDIYRVQMPNITPHICRHTYCSNMAKSGMNPKTLQYLMGHSDIGGTLNTYTHLGLEDAEDELKRLEDLQNARKELERTQGEKPVPQRMFKAI